MNILFLTSWYPTDENPHKGIFVLDHAAAVAGRENKVVVLAITLSHSDRLFETEQLHFTDSRGLETYLIRIRSRYHNKIHAITPLLNRYVSKCFSEKVRPVFRPDIIHANVLSPGAIMGRRLALQCGIPYIVTEHWSKVGRFMQKNLFARAGRKAYNEASAITCVSDFLRQSISPYVQHTERIHIVPNIVDASVFTFAEKPAEGPLVFCATATWRLPKRPDLFIGALETAAAGSDRPIELHLFGDGPQLEEYRTKNFPPNFKIVFRGYCNKPEIAQQLQRSHFFLHASEVETFSIVVAEALATGTPVIASDAGALPELVKAPYGLLCPNTPEGWKDAVQKALILPYDYAAISRENNSRFSAAAVGDQFNRLYEEALQQRKPSAH